MASVAGSSSKPTKDVNDLQIAVAIALLRSKQLRQRSSSSSVSEEDAQRWKRKAKERKQELTALREELKQVQESGKEVRRDVFPLSCKCHFFDGCGALNSDRVSSGGEGGSDGVGGCDHWIDDVLRRRFLRHVRWKERQRRLEGPIRKRHCIDSNDDDEMERLSTSVDFLVELSGSVFAVTDMGTSFFAASSHQAVDSIVVSLEKLLLSKKDDEMIEELVYSLITRLLQRMCTGKDGPSASDFDPQLYIQHLVRKLSNEPFVGQRAMLLVCQRISSLADSLAVTDPFDDTFPDMHDCMFMMIQLTEFMISDNLQIWTTNDNSDSKLFEEWLRSILQARNALGVLEYRNGLYLIYLERVIGEVANKVGPLSNQGKLDVNLLSSLFC